MPRRVVTAGTTARREAITAGGAVPRGHVRLVCGDPAMSLVVLLGPEPPQLTGGVGGWSVVERPQAVGMTIWDGVEPYQLSLSLMFDGWAGKRSQEWALGKLLRVARGDSESPPGVIRLQGLPFLPSVRWVIENLDYGEAIFGVEGNRRMRQPVTLTLRQYVPPSWLRRRKSAYGSSTKYVVIRAQKGDTPAKIAKRRRLKSWKVVRDANRKLKLKANTKIKHGTKVRVPKTKPQAREGGKDKGHRGRDRDRRK